MISLVKYELKRDRFKSLIIMIGVILCVHLLLPRIFPYSDRANPLLGIGGMTVLAGLLLVMDRRITHLAKDTLFENREHMMLIPKSILKIVSANAIVAYVDCIIFTGILISILQVDMGIKLLRGLVLVNLIFLFYVLFTCLYLLSGKIIKKPLFAAITGLLTTIGIIILSIIGRAIDLFETRIEIATILVGFLAVLGILAIAASLGHKFYLWNKEAKLMIIIGVLSIACFGILIHTYINRIVENTNLPFVMDNEIIGKWETTDFIDDYIEYTPREVEDDFIFEGLIVYENGIAYRGKDSEWIKESTWTKGYIINFPLEHTKSQYIVQEIDGDTYLFVEWKSGDYVYLRMKPNYYVFKKIT